MRKLYDFLGGRKVTFAFFLTAIMITFIVMEKATINEFTDFMKWVFLTYVGGNATTHIAKGIGNRKS